MKIKNNNKIADISIYNEKQESIKYMIEKKTFIITPVYKKSGEHIREILLKLMQSEVKKT